MIRFVHTADIHFGMENYGRLDIKTGIHSRLLDFQKAVELIIDRAIVEQVDFFLFSGDTYKTHNPTPTHQRLLLGCFLRLYQAKIPVVIVVGNHDHPLSFGKAHALEIFGQLPLDGFYVIAKPQTLLLQTKSGPVQIVGVPWPTRSLLALQSNLSHATAAEVTASLSQVVALIIEKSAEQLDPAVPAVLAGHLTVSSGIFSGSEKRAVYGTDPVLMPSQLAIKPFDYVGLGHLHRYQNLNPSGHPAVVYSGSPERIDFGERKEEKGFCLVTIYDKSRTEHEFITLATRKFVQIEVQINEDRNQTDQILEAIAARDIAEAIVKIVYFVPAGLREKIDLMLINHACITAWHVIGVQCVRGIAKKTQRPIAKIDMDLETLLTTYFTAKPEFSAKKEQYITCALELAAQQEEVL